MSSDQDEGTPAKVALAGLSGAGLHPSLRGPLPRPAGVFPAHGLSSFLPPPCPSTTVVLPSTAALHCGGGTEPLWPESKGPAPVRAYASTQDTLAVQGAGGLGTAGPQLSDDATG